jgi:hypothetical protein
MFRKILFIVLGVCLCLFGYTTGMIDSITGGSIWPSPSTFGSSAGVEISAASGKATIGGTGNINNNKMDYDFETNVDIIWISGNNSSINYCPNSDDVFVTVSKFDGTATYTNNTIEASRSAGTAFQILADTNDRFYVGKSTSFDKIYFDFSTSGAGITLVVKYSKGGGVWGDLTITDGTTALSADGTIVFTPPVDWAVDTVNSITALYLELSASAISTPPTAFLVKPENISIFKLWGNYNDTSHLFEITERGRISTNGDFYNNSTNYMTGMTYLQGKTSAVGQTVTYANDGHISNAKMTALISGNGGAVTLDTDPAIDNGSVDGQLLILQGTSDTNTVTIADNCNLQTPGGTSLLFKKGTTLICRWSSADSDWYPVAPLVTP